MNPYIALALAVTTVITLSHSCDAHANPGDAFWSAFERTSSMRADRSRTVQRHRHSDGNESAYGSGFSSRTDRRSDGSSSESGFIDGKRFDCITTPNGDGTSRTGCW